VNNIDRFIKKDAFAAYCGIELLEYASDSTICRLKVAPHHLNCDGCVDCGVIFTLADYAFATASNSGRDIAVGIEAAVSFMCDAEVEVLTARALKISSGGRLAFYQIDVADGLDRVVASFRGTAYRKFGVARKADD